MEGWRGEVYGKNEFGEKGIKLKRLGSRQPNAKNDMNAAVVPSILTNLLAQW